MLTMVEILMMEWIPMYTISIGEIQLLDVKKRMSSIKDSVINKEYKIIKYV
jgi:hypothetical protein